MSKRGENIYKRKDGRWEARYVKQILPDGSKKYGSVYGHSYNEAKEKQKAILFYTEEKTKPRQKKLTLFDVYSLWIEEVIKTCKPNTISKYKSIYNNHISALHNVLIINIDKNTICDFTFSLSEKHLSNKTINDILLVLNMIINYASEEYGMNTPKIKYLKEDKKDPRYLSVCEQKRLANYLKESIDIYKFGVLVAMFTGMRIGELCALKWEDIKDDSIVITKTMTRVSHDGKSEIIILPPKSESSKRVVPFPRELQPYYNMFNKSGYVLSDKKKMFTEPRYMQMKFEKYVKDCDLKDVTFHTLRHSFATRCIEAGVDAKTVSELLGHSDIKITLNRYVHSSFELKQNSIEKMQKLLA